ncbi:MAG: 30S ribosome-binding factor RbfA [Bacteroidales bacterium]|jgi:ribosome-binding factor A|nr:30S ribosome-binding factor RbfA [Bacteroidales bacterium]MBP5724560.1 30S ribosome-binding factor RbfA [Bacteroidales bacterium]MBQ3676048.1 30S ribosome-binding factor RbfA [Bacteroidales bacterium]MBQ4215472.1 30S ribosome-binding factor RbfA [Bacteroidales bacterium]MBR4497340.1 30S ribosome-binding factor RbfA [Bacteroidales bacterium]
MESTRQNKVARLLQKELGDIFQKESMNMFRGALISVTVVRVAPDLSFAKVYVSIFAPSKDEKTLFESIQDKTKTIRQMLAQKVAKQLRIIPELAFYIDDSIEYQENIERLLHSSNSKEQEK